MCGKGEPNDMENGGKALVLTSGGLDSTTLLAFAVDKHGAQNVHAMSLLYGQKHAREMESARMVAAHYGVELHTLDLTAVFLESDSSLLAHSTEAIPHADYAEQMRELDSPIVSTYVPFRNGMFLSSAAAMAGVRLRVLWRAS